MPDKRLGKIEKVYFGIGGYQDACIGINFTLTGDGWGVCDNRTAWDAEKVHVTEHSKWTEEDRDSEYSKIVRYISKLLCDAKVETVDGLEGIPVEVEFNGMCLKEWRILTEVL